MNTTVLERRRRRRHSAEFKAEAVAACRQAGGIDRGGGDVAVREREPAAAVGRGSGAGYRDATDERATQGTTEATDRGTA